MGRILIVLLVIVGLGLAIRYASSGRDGPQKVGAATVGETGPELTPAGNASGASAARSGPDTEERGLSGEDQASEAEPPPIEATAGADPAPSEEVLLGTSDLTQGIPGEGPLAVEEIRRWLADERSHAVLHPTLPLGLAGASGQITGLEENPLTRAKIELGRQLFFDPRLSSDHTISCASCHHPDFGYTMDTQFGVGVDGQTGDRNSPVAYNRILSSVQFWDGRAETLEEQAKGPIANPIEMANTHEACVEHLREIEGYRVQFERIFPDGVTIDNVAQAIASFERVLVTGPSPWDYYERLRAFEEVFAADLEDLEYLQEEDPDLYEEYLELKQAADAQPMSESAKRGAELFFSERVGCTACHAGANFTDEEYHNLGVGMDADEPDWGRYAVTGKEEDKGAFKTPTVRNVELTAPYMHDGSQETLEEVVEWYDKGGHPNPWLSDKIQPLELTDQEKADLVAFMKSLTGPLPEVEHGRLPE